MAFQSGLFHFHHDLEGSHDTDMQAHLCVEHTGILDVLGLQLDLLFINGRTGQLGQSLGNFLAGDLAVQAATVSASWKSAAASLPRAIFTAEASATAASLRGNRKLRA